MSEDIKPEETSPANPEGAPSGPNTDPGTASAPKEPHTPDPPTRGQAAATPIQPAEEVVKATAPPAQAIPPKPVPPKAAHAATAPKAPAVMATTPWESDLTGIMKDRFGVEITEFASFAGQNFLVAKPQSVIPILDFLKLEADFDYLVDVTAVHWPNREMSFDLVYVLYSFARNERIRIKTHITEGYRPRTATGVHLTADWLEREVFDMFGIEFEGHPNMKRILMPDEWQGYPLRKDYDIVKQDERWVQENIGIESAQ